MISIYLNWTPRRDFALITFFQTKMSLLFPKLAFFFTINIFVTVEVLTGVKVKLHIFTESNLFYFKKKNVYFNNSIKKLVLFQ